MIYSIAHALVQHHETAEKAQKHARFRAFSGKRKALRLKIDGDEFLFRCLEEFSFAVEARTSVPNERYIELLSRSPEELWQEAENIKSAEKQLADILEDALCDATHCGAAIQELGLQVYSKDHHWRDMMAELSQLDDEFDAYKRLALIKYMQYLGARQELLRRIFAMKTQTDADEQPTADGDDEFDGTRETVLFDVREAEPLESTAPPMQRLPQGEAVRVHALPGHPVLIRLAKYRFTLAIAMDGPWSTHTAVIIRYRYAKTWSVGGNDNDVRLSQEFKNISRRHLIAEPIDDHTILITDLSSHGTFAPPLQMETSTY